MDEYIKREDALDALLLALVGTGLQNRAISAVKDVNTADVVPKSEVEKLKAELEHYHKANLRQSLIIGQMDLTHRQFLKELDEIFKEHKEGFYCDWYLYSRYDELKNKYKEQKENGSDDERPNRRNV